MQIKGICPYNLNVVKATKKQQSPSFQGLTHFMESGIKALPYQEAQRLVASYDRPNLVVGHFPQDILNLIKSVSKNPLEIKSKIQLFNQALGEQADKIHNIDNEIIRKVMAIDPLDFSSKAVLQYYNNDFIGKISTDIDFSTDSQKMESLLNDGNFEKVMKEIGIIPQDGSVKFNFIGKGTYKNCFRMSFLDANEQNLIHPKAFVTGKYANIGEESNRIVRNKLKNYIAQTPFEDFRKNIMQSFDDLGFKAYETEKMENLLKSFYETRHKSVQIYNLGAVMENFYDINGIFPEANAALSIRKAIGGDKIKTSNMVEPFVFDLKKHCGLLEFADVSLPKVNNNFDLEKNGIVWIDNNPKNHGVNESSLKTRVIDYGCMVPESLSDRYYQD